MFDKALEHLAGGDSFVAIEFLGHQADALAVAGVYNKLLKHLYYEEKNIQAVINMGRAGIQYALSAAAAPETDPAQAKELRGKARVIAYNLASYTWPGWEEPGIDLGRAEVAQGLEAAVAATRLSNELGLDALTRSRSDWMLAAQQMAAGNLPQAAGNFKQAADLARMAAAPGEAQLSEGFTALVSLLASPGDPAAEARYMTVKRHLAGEKDGHFFVEQLETARRVFGS